MPSVQIFESTEMFRLSNLSRIRYKFAATILLCIALVTVLSTQHAFDSYNDSKSNNSAFQIRDVAVKEGSRLLECVPLLRQALSESPVSQIMKDVFLLYTDELTIDMKNKHMQEMITKRKILAKNATEITRIVQLSQCSKIVSTEITVGICTVFNGVHYNFQEWMLHYLFLGVKHIVVYDVSTPGSAINAMFLEDTLPFVESGFLTIIPRFKSDSENVDHIQFESFRDCYLNTLSNMTFIGSLDGDEFISLQSEPCLQLFLIPFLKYGGLRIPWKTVTPFNVTKHDPQRSFLSQYVYAIKTESVVHVKTIGNVQFYQDVPNQHYIHTSMPMVDSEFNTGEGPFAEKLSTLYSKIEILHIYSPGWLYFILEKICGDGEGRKQHASVRSTMMITDYFGYDVELVEKGTGHDNLEFLFDK